MSDKKATLHPQDLPERSRSRSPRQPRPRTPQRGDITSSSAGAAGRQSPAIHYTVTTPGEALHGATDRRDFEGVCRILQASPDCVDARNARGRTALHVAAQIGQTDIVQKLLQHGAEVNARSNWKYTPLMFAAENVHPEVIMILVRAGADLEAKTKHGSTPLQRAVLREKNNPDTVYLLAVLGSNVNTTNNDGCTAIHTAVAANRYLNALTLCAFGADSNLKNSRGQDAFNIAASLREDARIRVTMMLQKWTNPGTGIQRHRQQLRSLVRPDGAVDLSAVLCGAAGEGHMSLVEFVLDVSGENAPSLVESVGKRRGWTPLHHAADGGESRIARILIDHGAVVDSLTKTHRWTPLLLAAAKGRRRTVEVLLERGADILAKTQQRKTAFELARDGQHEKTLQVLGDFAHRIEDSKQRVLALILFQATNPQGLAQFGLEESGKAEDRKSTPMRPVEITQEDEFDTDGSSEIGAEETSEHMARVPGTGDHNLARGSFDGALYSAAATSSELSQSPTLKLLGGIWDYFDFKSKHDKAIKVAILDTGLDLSHRDWDHPRALRFENSQPIHAEREPRQHGRVRACKDFTGSHPTRAEDDMIDLDGHGTQVAGLILRFAPRSELYIARICEGNNPRPETVSSAIEWAIGHKVDIINMSFGFSSRQGVMRAALEQARQAKILVFAAMSNDGNNSPYGAAWPARNSSLTIGVHSCVEGGRRYSDFTPPHVHGSHNFMVVGEGVVTHWPQAKGGGFKLAKGTSYATPIAVAMAALILGFTEQHICKREREAHGFIDLDDLRELRELGGMGRMLQQVSVRDDTGNYSYIHPRLLWKDFDQTFAEDKSKVRNHAWNVIQEALMWA